MTKRLTFLLLLPSILILSFTPAKQVKIPALKKSVPACTSSFTVELMGCRMPNFALDYISVAGIQLNTNIGCYNYTGPTYIGAASFVSGPTTVTVHSSVGTAYLADIWDHNGAYLGGYYGNGSNTITFSTDLIGCGESYTIRVWLNRGLGFPG